MNKSQQELITSIINDVDDMTIATVRDDDFPQATTVSYFNDGDTIYFAAGSNSQKAQNIAKNDRVSLTINRPYKSWDEIQGLSMGAHARSVTDPEELKAAEGLLTKKFPQAIDYEVEGDESLSIYRIEPVAVSILDYTNGFGHTENVQY